MRCRAGSASERMARSQSRMHRFYKALHRLERGGCVEAEWGLSENNRRARYYRLTARGRRRLRSEESAWRRYAEAVFKVLEPV